MRRFSVVAGFACGLVLLFCGSCFAAVPSVWWGVATGARPASLSEAPAVSESQRVTVTGVSGVFQLVDTATGQSASFAYNASKAVVQSGLEGLYGAGDVRVTGGPGDATGSSPYIVKFANGLADQQVAVMGSQDAELGGSNKSVVVEEVVRGADAGTLVSTVENLGTASVSETSGPVSITDVLPEGLRAVSIEAVAGEGIKGGGRNRGPVVCVLATLTCTYEGGSTFEAELQPDEEIEVLVGVVLEDEAQEGVPVTFGQNTITVSGGGGGLRSASRQVSAGEAVPFGVEDYEFVPEENGGGIDLSAGSHPFQLTTTVTLNQNAEADPVKLPKDLHFMLPEGFVGNPTPFAQCTDEQFSKTIFVEKTPGSEGIELPNECAASTAIGIATITVNEPKGLGGVDTLRNPVFNLTPLAGEPARFGFKVGGIAPVFLDTEIGPQTNYRVVVSSDNISEIPGFLSAKVTLWGVPGEAIHDAARGWSCVYDLKSCSPLGATSTPPFLLMPSSCEQPFTSTATGDSWKGLVAESVQMAPLTYTLPAPSSLIGCNQLPFEPSIEVSPDVPWGNTPTGLKVNVSVPQQASLNPGGLAEATVRNTTVTLPPGLVVSPGGADGLEGCSELQAGVQPSLAGEALSFTGGLEPACPDASKIGTVELETPLLPNKLEGSAYLAAQNANPFGSLIAIYLVMRDPVSGTLVKLAGEVHPEADGQLVSTFQNTPQLPFENLRLDFFGEPRAPLSTPPLCGRYETHASFVSWSSPASRASSSSFQIEKGPHGGPCIDPASFTPELQAGSLNIQAGAFTPLTTTMTRPDTSQPLGRLQMLLPQGLSGVLSSVKLCPEPQASLGTCGPESLIGHTTVSAGLGDHPVTVKYPGNVYITGPYKGAPYGLSVANPAAAGPFDLGTGPCDCVVVRAKIEVNPITAQLTVTSDPLPTILQGVPLQIQHVNVMIDREGFTFNPTNCDPTSITATLTSSQGTTAPLTTPFQATNCASLAFKPGFKVSTQGKTSRKDGASLTVNLTYPKNAFGKDTNIKKVRVELPKALPSRLSTLQQACTKAQFEANPAGCPAASVVGHAKAITPILPVPLEGPAYFVSYGAEWPQLILLLQGYGITIDLHGETHISKGVTSSTFSTVPDQPVQSFQLTLPEGPNSALAAPGGKLCTRKLVMPTSFTGQNGATYKQSTKIKVTGCKATKTKKKHHKHKHHNHHKHKNKARHKKHKKAHSRHSKP